MGPEFPSQDFLQERKGHINLRKIPGTPAGCPWDTPGGTNRGLPAGVPGISSCLL